MQYKDFYFTDETEAIKTSRFSKLFLTTYQSLYPYTLPTNSVTLHVVI